MPNENDRSFLDNLLDKIEPIADKVVGGLSHVHHPDKDYSNEAPPPPPPTEIPRVVFGQLRSRDGRQGIFHVYQTMDSTLCNRHEQPESWWRPNTTSREAIVMCFGCLSRLAMFTAAPKLKELPSGDAP